MRHGLIMTVATFLAGGLDYVYQVVAGRMLQPAEYGIFIAVTALLQIAVYLTNSIRNVVAYYTAELGATANALPGIGHLLRRSWGWSWRWGIVAMIVVGLLSPLIAPLLQIPTVLPMLAASLTILLLFLRPVTDGTLQGIQRFSGLGSVQVLQAFLRLIVGAGLLWLGWQAFGALLALPLAMLGGLLLALWLLRPQFRVDTKDVADSDVSLNYSLVTVAGLLFYGLIINLDAIVVKGVFSPEIAGNYGPVVTLGKMSLFFSLAIGQVLFPKVTQRQAIGRDPRPILLIALLVTVLPGLLLTVLYFIAHGFLVQTIFGDAYADPGQVLPIVGLAMTLFASLNIWLNYALSAGKPLFIASLGGVLLLQVAGLALFHDSLNEIALVILVTGLTGNIAGAFTTLGYREEAAVVR
jgi:O-antigen/teichoic acid export membrane protein